MYESTSQVYRNELQQYQTWITGVSSSDKTSFRTRQRLKSAPTYVTHDDDEMTQRNTVSVSK